MIVVDTNIIAHLLIESERTAPARALWQNDPDWRVPTLWRHEFLNVLANYVRHGGMPAEDAHMVWDNAVVLIHRGETEFDLAGALELAITYDISAYDAQFVALAEELSVSLITADKRLLQKFPKIAVSVDQL